jgi:carboxymethylenebutenolidase
MHALTADQISLVPRLDLSRHLFAVTSLAAGFASAVMPVSAATVTTDTEGLEVGETKVAVRDGDMPAYYARPQGTGLYPTCWSCRRSSASTSTSRTSAAA